MNRSFPDGFCVASLSWCPSGCRHLFLGLRIPGIVFLGFSRLSNSAVPKFLVSESIVLLKITETFQDFLFMQLYALTFLYNIINWNQFQIHFNFISNSFQFQISISSFFPSFLPKTVMQRESQSNVMHLLFHSPHVPGVGQAEARTSGFHWVSHMGGRDPKTWNIHCLPSTLAGNWIWSRVTKAVFELVLQYWMQVFPTVA